MVVEVLSAFDTPVSLETLVRLIDKDGRYLATLNQWARENGGVKGSVRLNEFIEERSLRCGLLETGYRQLKEPCVICKRRS